MSSGQILLTTAVILSVYLDWALIKWLQRNQNAVAKIKSTLKQMASLWMHPLLSAIKNITTILNGWWKHIKPLVFDLGDESLSQQFSQKNNLSGSDADPSRSMRRMMLFMLGLILSITLTALGIILMRGQQLAAGAILLVLSLPLFIWVVRSIEKSHSAIEKKHPMSGRSAPLTLFFVPGLVLLATLFLTGSLILNVTDYLRTPELDYSATTKWMLSVLGLTMGILWIARWKPIHPRVILEWVRANQTEFGWAAVVILGGLIIRMLALTEHPYPWSGDEASVGLNAVRIMNGEITNLFDTSWSGQPNVSFLPTTFNLLVFGKTMFAIRMTSVLTGTLSILALYLLAREWFGSEVALIAGSFLIAYPVHLQFSRIGVDNIFDSLMAPLVIWLIFRAIRLGTLPAYLLAGVATGLTIYTYVGTRLVLAMAIGTIIYIAIKQKDYLKTNLPQLGSYLAGLVVTAAPQATFFIKHPDLFMTRIGQEGIFLNGWLSSQVEQTGRSTWQILFDQFSKTTLVFIAQNTGTNFLNFDRPYLTILGSVFFLIGLASAFGHFFDQRYFILQMWFWSVLTLGGFLTVSPPANTRLVMVIPATGLFIALGILQISNLLLNLKFKRVLVHGLVTLLILTLAYQNLSFYFGPYWQGRNFQDASGELAMETGLRLQKLGEGYDFYLFGLPRVFAAFPTTDFLTPNNPKYDMDAELISGLSLHPGRGAYFVAIPENRELLQQIIEKYPGGSSETVTRKMTSEILYYAYVLPPQTAGIP